MLLLGVGRVTRLLRFLTALPKTYAARSCSGTETTTLDAAGEVVATHDMAAVTLDAGAAAAAERLTGDILQVPPMVSAVKVGGRRLHELARQGDRGRARAAAGDRAPLRRRADSTASRACCRVEVECSSGTYVRTLAADLGHALGGGAHLRNLRRTAVGSFTLAEARPLDEIARAAADAEAVRDYPPVAVADEVAAAVGPRQGARPADVGSGVDGDGPWAVLDADGALLAVYEAPSRHDGEARRGRGRRRRDG